MLTAFGFLRPDYVFRTTFFIIGVTACVFTITETLFLSSTSTVMSSVTFEPSFCAASFCAILAYTEIRFSANPDLAEAYLWLDPFLRAD